MKKLFLIFVILLVSCTPDPRNQADADVTRMQAEQIALDRAAERERQAQQFALEQAERQATSDHWIQAQQRFIAVSMAVANLAVALVISSSAVGLSLAAIGLGRSFANWAWVRSTLIQMNPASGQFPLFVSRLGKGRYSLTDMNTGQVRMLDVRSEGDAQMVAAAMAGRMNTALAFYAAKAGPNAQGVAMVGTNPVIVEGGQDGRA